LFAGFHDRPPIAKLSAGRGGLPQPAFGCFVGVHQVWKASFNTGSSASMYIDGDEDSTLGAHMHTSRVRPGVAVLPTGRGIEGVVVVLSISVAPSDEMKGATKGHPFERAARRTA
jgi:hypothetical protein